MNGLSVDEVYNDLLERLDISLIKYKTIITDNTKFRIDDKYYNKDYLCTYKKILSKKHIILGNAIEVLTDFHSNGSYASIAKVFELLDSEDYAYMVRTTDLENDNYTENVKYVTKKCYDYLQKSKVYGGELIINKIGCPGRTYLMPFLNRPVSLGMNQFLLRTDKNQVLEAFLWVYFNSNIGKKIIYRKVNGTAPLTMDKESIRSLPVPKFSIDFQEKIAQYVERANAIKLQSKAKYEEAEKRLLSELDLDDMIFEQDNDTVSVRNYKQVLNSSRIDAEYYLPKYDKLFDVLSHYPCKKLGVIAPPFKSIEPGSEAYDESGIPFYRVNNISKYGLSETDVFLDEKKYFKEELSLKKDTVLFSKDGSIGIAYKVEKDEKAITSSALLHLRIVDEDTLPDYLALVLNSKIVKMQAARDAGGSVIDHWKPDEIKNVIIPIISKDSQSMLASIVKESFELKYASDRIVEKMREIVDAAIEKNEAEGLRMLEEMETNESIII